MKKIKFFSHQIKNYTYNVIFKKMLITLAKRLLYSIHINCPYQESTYYLQKNQTLPHYQMKKSQVLFSQALLFFFSPFICPTLAFYLVGVSESHRFILKCSIIVTSIVYQSTFFGGGDRANKREKKPMKEILPFPSSPCATTRCDPPPFFLLSKIIDHFHDIKKEVVIVVVTTRDDRSHFSFCIPWAMIACHAGLHLLCQWRIFPWAFFTHQQKRQYTT